MIMFWVTLLAVSILLYVLLDGFDLGVGMLFGLTSSETRRRAMLSAVAPIWDGNETWLVVTAVILWGAFPVVYATLLSAFYLPLLVMLAGLILRGVAFEYRHKTERMRWLWDWSFAGGSFAATFMPGFDGRCARWRACRWQTVNIPAATSAGLVPSRYSAASDCVSAIRFSAPVGWSRNVKPTSGTQPIAVISLSCGRLLVFLIVVFVYALVEDLPMMGRWIERPYLFVFPVIGALAAIVLAASIRFRQDDYCPFTMVVLIFLSAFGTLAISFWPYMIPFVITIEEAAAPHSSLAFMFWGEGLFVFPLMLLYTAISYRVFRGKVASTPGHY